jgi:hypothetical protein
MMVDREQEIRDLQHEIEEIKASLPAHSVGAETLMLLEELEERLVALEEGSEDAQA